MKLEIKSFMIYGARRWGIKAKGDYWLRVSYPSWREAIHYAPMWWKIIKRENMS